MEYAYIQINEALAYHLTPDGIQMFRCTVMNQGAIDMWFQVVTPIYYQTPTKETVRIYLELDIMHWEHLTYAFQKLRLFKTQLNKQHPHVRYAIVYEQNLNIATFHAFMKLLPLRHLCSISYFPINNRRSALDWLRGNKEAGYPFESMISAD